MPTIPEKLVLSPGSQMAQVIFQEEEINLMMFFKKLKIELPQDPAYIQRKTWSERIHAP